MTRHFRRNEARHYTAPATKKESPLSSSSGAVSPRRIFHGRPEEYQSDQPRIRGRRASFSIRRSFTCLVDIKPYGASAASSAAMIVLKCESVCEWWRLCTPAARQMAPPGFLKLHSNRTARVRLALPRHGSKNFILQVKIYALSGAQRKKRLP